MKSVLLSLGLLLSTALIAQNFEIITSGSISDAKKMTSAYLKPIEIGLGLAGNSGNINFTKSKRKIHFNIGISISGALTPKSDRTYDINQLELEEIVASDPNNTIAQTISGGREETSIESKSIYYKPALSYPFYKEVPIVELETPQGGGVPVAPYPVLTAGLYGYGTHINAKLLPNLSPTTNAELVFYGLSIQHNLDEFIPKIKEWPVQFAISGGYEYSHMRYKLDITADEGKSGVVISPENGPYDNQEITMTVTSIPVQLVAYHDFSGFTLYGGIGYNFTTADVALKGNYPVYVGDPMDFFKLTVTDIVDPYDYSNEYNNFRLDFGLNYQIGFMKFMASYSLSKYQVFHMGLGVAI